MRRVNIRERKWLQTKMMALGIKEDDIEEKFIRSSGRGGQKVNKTSSCVYIKHIPTGIEVKCHRERRQVLNRFIARKILAEKIEKLRRKAFEDKKKAHRKLPRGRPLYLKERILKFKKRRSQIKRLRAYRGAVEDLI